MKDRKEPTRAEARRSLQALDILSGRVTEPTAAAILMIKNIFTKN